VQTKKPAAQQIAVAEVGFRQYS